MCIICDNDEIGTEYLSNMGAAIAYLKESEKNLLKLSNVKNIVYEPNPIKARNYNKAHKRLVKIRRQLSEVEKLRCGHKI